MSESEQVKSVIVDEANAEAVPHEAISNSPASLGAQLASKREQLGWSVAEVASHLKLAPRQIDAIEADNYAALPTMVMTRGFIRSYAKLLGLDATVLLAQISPAAAPKDMPSVRHNQLSTPFSESRFSLMGRTKFAYKWLVIGAVLLLLLAVAIRLDLLPMVENALHASAERATAAAASSAAASGQASAELPLTPASAEAPAAQTASSATSTPAADAAVVSESAVNAAAATTAPAAVAGDNGNQLSLNFRQDSWVEIKRADNTVLISRLVKAGDSQSFDVTQPVSVTIGNLAGVDATLRGEPVDLKGSSKTNVARLTLK
ncbi:helix-turn-helix domain protein [Collimonas arenae]|uniref:Helix-turn-helix domain protein n=1 Tax=Collimonas arenae TaxID=279058 RepID=A0A127QJH6_9BURK|nr:helix-turn-helix domain-containing protein [Collimonas arenae]AMP00352.1 helix-turn-helix domain protein [Collimonas arenae]AMP10230.1 helix-turn-helix domain protein [Collimonas arenae]